MRAMPDAAGHTLTLFLPGLFTPVPDVAAGAATRLPALETWLARAAARTGLPRGAEAVLFALFGADIPDDADLPVAAVTRALDLGVIDNGWWLRADPVHLHPQRDRLVLEDGRRLELTQDEATRLANEILEHYRADGWLLKAARPGRWYLKPPRAARIRTTPLAEVAGRDIHPYLPRGEEASAWHTRLNEMQILLHTAKVNEERERTGKPPVNSLWFWGGGRLPKLAPVHWAGLWGEEPLSLAFARLAQVPSHARPAGFAAWRREADPTGDHLVVLDDLLALQQEADSAAWQETLACLERDWIAPLAGAVRAGTLPRAELIADTGTRFVLTRAYARRWWRRRRPLAAYA